MKRIAAAAVGGALLLTGAALVLDRLFPPPLGALARPATGRLPPDAGTRP